MAQKVTKPGEEVVLDEEIGHVRLITLNQPRRLNVISVDMLTLLVKLLEKWEKDDDAQLMIIKGSGPAFSAGGDLKALYYGKGSIEGIYRVHWLAYHIHTYKKTQVALIHGICYGGGACIGVSMKFSVVTEKTVFAAPEALIGAYPPGGICHMLSRLPGHLGEFLGLTGTRLNGKELLVAGLASHFVSSEKLMELQKRLISLNTGEENAIRSAIEEFSSDVQIDEESVLNKREIINECFSKNTVEEIVTSLEAETRKVGNDAIVGMLGDLKRSSPMALKIILESGIRAKAIDKDNAPRWNPSTLEAVDAEKIKLVLQPFEDHDLEVKIPVREYLRWEGKYEDSPYASKDFLRSHL